MVSRCACALDPPAWLRPYTTAVAVHPTHYNTKQAQLMGMSTGMCACVAVCLSPCMLGCVCIACKLCKGRAYVQCGPTAAALAGRERIISNTGGCAAASAQRQRECFRDVGSRRVCRCSTWLAPAHMLKNWKDTGMVGQARLSDN